MKILSNFLGMKLKLFSLLTLIMLLQSCTKNNNDPLPVENTYYYLTAAQLNQTPYFTNKAFDTISYASDKGDTLTFVKTKTDTTWYGERANANPEDQSMKYYQTINNRYSTIKGNGRFEVRNSKKGYYYGTQSDIIEINFSDLNFYIYDDRIGSRGKPNYLDSLSVNSRTYFDVVFVFHEFTYSGIAKAYANKSFGVFQIEDKRSNVIYNLTK
jgi:hypothetical protein